MNVHVKVDCALYIQRQTMEYEVGTHEYANHM
jgi:hypothetical protein